MASGKRASMREGPLAELFRKTETDPEAGVPKPPPAAGTGARAEPARRLPRRQARATPTPQERLRHAFCSDLPENVMEPVASVRARPAAGRRHVVLELGHADVGVRRDEGRPAVIRVVGVGGAGVNAVNRMIEAEVDGVEFLAVNTDVAVAAVARRRTSRCTSARTSRAASAPARTRSSAATPRWRTTTASSRCSRAPTWSSSPPARAAAPGTGAAPVVARIARELGALTVGIVTKPFGFEGSRRRDAAEPGVEALAHEVDTLIVVPNNRLLSRARQADVDDRGVPRRRRRAAPGRAGHLAT